MDSDSDPNVVRLADFRKKTPAAATASKAPASAPSTSGDSRAAPPAANGNSTVPPAADAQSATRLLAPPSSPASSQAQAKQPPGTVAVRAKLVRDHVQEICRSIHTGLKTLKELELGAELYHAKVNEGQARYNRLTFVFPDLDGKIYVTPAQVKAKDEFVAELNGYEKLIYEAVALTVEFRRLRRWVETHAETEPPQGLHFAPGAEINAHLLDACAFVRDGKAHLERCTNLLTIAGLALADCRLKEATRALLDINNVATIFRNVEEGIADGTLIDIAV